MAGFQKKIALSQIEGYLDSQDSNLADRLDAMGTGTTSRYTFNQQTPATIWEIEHNLNFLYPEVKVVDSESNFVIGDITYMTENKLKIEFTSPTSGTAYIRS